MRKITLLLMMLCLMTSIIGQSNRNLESSDLLVKKASIAGTLTNYQHELNKDLFINYTLQTPDFKGISQGRAEITEDGSFKIDLENRYPYQKINLQVGDLYKGVLIVHEGLDVVIDLKTIKSRSDNFSSKGVEFGGEDGPLTEFYNAFIEYKSDKKIDIRADKFSSLRNRTSYSEFKLKQLKASFEELEKIEKAYTKKHGKTYKWLLENERQSEFYGDLVSIYVGRPMPKHLWEEMLNHSPAIVSEMSNRLYGILAAKLWSHDEKEIRAFSRLIFKSEAESEAEKKQIDLFITEQDKKKAGVPYDNEVYAKGLQDYVAKYESKLADAKLDLYLQKLTDLPEGKIGLVTIKGQPLDLNDRHTYSAKVEKYIKIGWQRELMEIEYNEELARIATVSLFMKNASGVSLEEIKASNPMILSTGGRLSQVSTGSVENLLQSFRSTYPDEALVLYVWNPSCSFCVTELMNSGLTYDRVEGKPIKILTLAIGQNTSFEKWEKVLQTSALQGDHFLLNNALSSEVIEYFQLPPVPAFLYFSADGTFDPYKVSSISDLQVSEVLAQGE